MKKVGWSFFWDILIIIVSMGVAVALLKSNFLITLLTSTKEIEYIGSFIAGLFFTSVFTTAPAIVALGEIAHANSVFFTALFGALGAVIGDLVIFRFVRDRFSDHLLMILGHQGGRKRVRALFRLKLFRWITFLLAGLIIASPLPDELAMSILGFSKIRASRFIPLSFVFNFIGILVIGLIAKAIGN